MSAGPLACWIDGVPGSAVPVDDRGFAYGDGLFETLLVRDGRVRFREAHFARLAQGCGKLGIAFDTSLLAADLERALPEAPPLAVLKIVVTRGSAARRGYRASGSEQARRVVSVWDTVPLPPAALEAGVELRVATVRFGENPSLAGLKHLNRLENVLAASESDDPRWFDALMLSASGHVVSGTACNLFLLEGDSVVTPLVDRCGIAGVMRRVVMRECAQLGIAALERRVLPGELAGVEAAFITNARIGVVPVRRLGEHAIRMNELVTRLRNHIEALDA